MKKLSEDIASTLSTWMDSADVKAIVDATRAATDEDTGRFRMVITTENLDRYQEVISIDGWELDHYLTNPVVLWGHDHYTPPVAVTDKLIKEDGKLIAEGRFAPTELGQTLRKLYDLGFQRASSVGFIEKERQGNLITKAELIEWSFVSVPANPYALGLALEKGISIDELVTKGILNVKYTEPTPEPEPEEDEAPEEETPASDEVLAEKIANLVVAKLKDTGALEEQEAPEPERTEDEPTADDTAEEQQLREFNEKRKALQDAATILSDVLAEARQAIAARK